jgi:hypothetical protein
MLGEDSNLAGCRIFKSKSMPKKDVRAIGEPNEDALAEREIASREVVAILTALLAEVLPKAWLPGFGHDWRHRLLRRLTTKLSGPAHRE